MSFFKWIALIVVHIIFPIGYLTSDLHLIKDYFEKDEW